MEVLLGLLGALVGAIAAIGAQFVNSRTSLRLDEQRQLREDVAVATRSLLNSLGAQQWLVWKARHNVLTHTDVDSYENQAQTSLNVIFSEIGVLSATWPKVYHRYWPLAKQLLDFDEQIGLAVIEFRSDPQTGISHLRDISSMILGFHWHVYEQVARVVEGEEVKPYDATKYPEGTIPT